LKFGEQCPQCGYLEDKNWRPAFGPKGLTMDVIEPAEVPEIVGSHKPKDTWTEGFWAYHLTKWLKRIPLAVYKANGGWYGDRSMLIGTDRKHVEAKRQLTRKMGSKARDNKSQTFLTNIGFA